MQASTTPSQSALPRQQLGKRQRGRQIKQLDTQRERERERQTQTAMWLLLTVYSMVPLGLWKDMRLPSFLSGVFFWPVSESKRGKVRITFMFLSPPACHKPQIPTALWADSSFVNDERASQPASVVRAELLPPLALSLSPALSPSLLSARSLSLFLSLFLSHSLTLALC